MTKVRLRPEIETLPPYRQGKPAAADSFKLSSNENPFEPLPSVVAAIGQSGFNRYPDALATRLRERLAERHAVTVDQLHVGAGSVSIIAQLIAAAATVGDEVLYSWRSFEAYPLLTTVAGATSVQLPNTPQHGHDLPAMAAAITDRTRLVLVCNPNNPTGTAITLPEFRAFMAEVPETVLVVLDEAYIEFAAPSIESGIPLLAEYPNLVVLRTFSKAYGLAGLRIGYGIGPEYVMDAVRSTAIPLAVTSQSVDAALASLEHEAELLERVHRISVLRDSVWQALVDQGWDVPRSFANFIWLPTGEDTTRVAALLSEHQIVARAFAPDGIRVTIGEPASIDKLLHATALAR
ncbi:MAG: histidinol-phosphate transaminase [Microbacteriaceae bacterium]